jgi:hypothetical protein
VRVLPLIASVRLRSPSWRMPTLWLPLFLIWPLVFVIVLPLAALGLLVALVLPDRSAGAGLKVLGAFYVFCCELRGTKIDVNGPDSEILISIC